MMLRTTLRALIPTLALAAFALTANVSFADDAKVPTTTAEHENLAKQYQEQATQFKKVADDHRAMAAAYGKAHPDSKGGVKNPWNVKMQKHCMMLAKDADKVATNAQKAADFHTARGKEVEGK